MMTDSKLLKGFYERMIWYDGGFETFVASCMVLIGGLAASFESSFGEMNAVYVGSSHVERRSTAVQTPFLPPL